MFFILSNLQYWLTLNYCCGDHLTYLTVIGADRSSVTALWYEPWDGIGGLFVALLPVILTVAVCKISLVLPVLCSKRSDLAIKLGVSALLIGMLFWALCQIRGAFIFIELESGGLSDAVAIFWFASCFPMSAYIWSSPFARRKILSILVCTIAWSFVAIWLALPYQWWLPFGGFLLTVLAMILYDPNRGGFWRQSITLFNAPQSAARAVALLVPAYSCLSASDPA